MKKVILTGFLPFGDYDFNPTEKSALYYNSRMISGIKIIGIVLPCTYFSAFEKLSNLMDEEKPDGIISMGLSSCVRGIRIETVFRNLMNGKYSDSNGYKPVNLPISLDKNAREFLSGNTNNLSHANILYSNNIPVEISGDADTFVCNSLGYLTTKKIIEDNLDVRNIFIHIPWTDDYRSEISLGIDKIFLEKDKYYKGIELLIKNI